MQFRTDRRGFLCITTAVGSACLLGPPSALAGLLLSDPGSRTLQAYDDIRPDYPVSALLLSDDGSQAYLAENDPKSLTSILHVAGVPDFRDLNAIKLGHDISSIALDPNLPDHIAVAGTNGEADIFSLVDVKTGEVRSLAVRKSGGVPVFANGGSGRIYFGNSASGSVRVSDIWQLAPLESALDTLRNAQNDTPSMPIPEFSGVARLAASADGSILFASAADKPFVVALSTDGEFSVIGQIGTPGQQQQQQQQQLQQRNLLPIAFDATLISSSRSKTGETSSFLLADVNQNRLVLADFNAVFSTFDIIADDRLDGNIGISGLSQSGLPDSFIHLASNADQSVILVGSPSSTTLDLYGRKGPTLQKLLPIRLSGLPQQVVISADGNTALALLQNGNLALLSSEQFDAPINKGGDPVYLGDEDTRRLQLELNRLGFPVGAIDGMTGPRTRDAVQEAIRRFNLDPKLTANDPRLLLEELQNVGKKN